jgi:hypothetical protein
MLQYTFYTPSDLSVKFGLGVPRRHYIIRTAPQSSSGVFLRTTQMHINLECAVGEIEVFVRDLYYEEITTDPMNLKLKWIAFGPAGVVRMRWEELPHAMNGRWKKSEYVEKRERTVKNRRRKILMEEKEVERRARVAEQANAQPVYILRRVSNQSSVYKFRAGWFTVEL